MSRQPELISHWYTLIDGLTASSRECYAAIRADLGQRQISRMGVEFVLWQESGVLSAKRLYLRVRRRRAAFDICAAPFGKGFFFSWRLALLPVANGWLFLTLLVAAAAAAFYWISWLPQYEVFRRAPAVFDFFFRYFNLRTLWTAGIAAAILVDVFLFILIWGFGGEDAVMAIPLLGWLYKFCFAQDTYYRIDTALMFQESVRRSVMDVIDGLLKQQGLRALSDEEKRPRIRDWAR